MSSSSLELCVKKILTLSWNFQEKVEFLKCWKTWCLKIKLSWKQRVLHYLTSAETEKNIICEKICTLYTPPVKGLILYELWIDFTVDLFFWSVYFWFLIYEMWSKMPLIFTSVHFQRLHFHRFKRSLFRIIIKSTYFSGI